MSAMVEVLRRSEQEASVRAGELRRYAGHLARDFGVHADTQQQKKAAALYQGVHDELSTVGAKIDGDTLLTILEERLVKTMPEASKKKLQKTIDFVGNNIRSPEYFRSDLKTYDQIQASKLL